MLKPYEYELEEFGPDGAVTGRFRINEGSGLGASVGWWESADHKRKLSVVLSEISEEQNELLLRIWKTKPQITSLIAGFDHACVRRTVGAACWGAVPLMPGTAMGGPEMVAYRALPNLLIAENVTALATAYHRLCIVQSGGLRCWQPYDPTLPLREPTAIPGFDHGITAMGESEGYICGVVSEALKCWDGSSLSSSSIREIISSGVAGLSSGDPQCAMVAGGGVKCWYMGYDQESKQRKLVIQNITGLKGEIHSLSAAGLDEQHFACAIDSEGLKCWGNNFARPLGRRPGNPVRNLPPGPIAGLETGVTQVATGSDHSCAIKAGKVYCWGGLNWLGQLGDGTTNYPAGPVEVKAISNAVQVAVAARYSCVLTSENRVFCWGDNESGQTGNASYDVCKVPNGKADAMKSPCNLQPVAVRGLE